MELPRYVQIEPVGQCNLACQMCPVWLREDGPDDGRPAMMAYETFTRLVDQFTALEHLHLQGLGEPLMHPRLFDMVAYAADRGVRVTTNTNLSLLSPRRAQECFTSGLSALHVSIDGATADTYQRIRRGARFARLLRNLEWLAEARQRHLHVPFELRMIVVLMRQNLHELPPLVQQARQWGFDSVFVQQLCHDFTEESLPPVYRPMRQFVDGQSLADENPRTIARMFDAARQVAAECGIQLRLPRVRPRPHPPGTPGRRRCGWPWDGMYISYQGLAMPCCMIATPDRANFGSTLNRPVGAVWNSTQYAEFRRRLASDQPPDVCRACSVYAGTF